MSATVRRGPSGSRPGVLAPDGMELAAAELSSGNWTVNVVKAAKDFLAAPPKPVPRIGQVAWYVPYTAVHPWTAEAAPADAVWVDVSKSPYSYYVALAEIWSRGETFATLEHDCACRPDIIKEFEECPEPWCLYGYHDICHPHCMEAWRNALGCTKFSAEIIAAVPDAMSSIPDGAWDWHNVCDGLGNNLRAAGFTHHWHTPPIQHHHQTDGVHGPQQWEVI